MSQRGDLRGAVARTEELARQIEEAVGGGDPITMMMGVRDARALHVLITDWRRLRGLIVSWGEGPRVGYGEAMAALEAEARAIREEEPRNQEALR